MNSASLIAVMPLAGGDLINIFLGGLVYLILLIFLIIVAFSFLIWVIPFISEVGLTYVSSIIKDPVWIILTIGCVLTIVFGVPSFYIAMNDESSVTDKANAMIVLQWILSGWGLGSGASIIYVVLTKYFGQDKPDQPP